MTDSTLIDEHVDKIQALVSCRRECPVFGSECEDHLLEGALRIHRCELDCDQAQREGPPGETVRDDSGEPLAGLRD